MDKKIYRLEVRLSKKDYDKFEKIRLKAGLTKTHLIRNLINKIEIKERVPEDYFYMVKYLSSIANNVNQIAHVVNATGNINKGQINALALIVDKCYKYMIELH